MLKIECKSLFNSVPTTKINCWILNFIYAQNIKHCQIVSYCCNAIIWVLSYVVPCYQTLSTLHYGPPHPCDSVSCTGTLATYISTGSPKIFFLVMLNQFALFWLTCLKILRTPTKWLAFIKLKSPMMMCHCSFRYFQIN